MAEATKKTATKVAKAEEVSSTEKVVKKPSGKESYQKGGAGC